jgi:hypothetical protein
VLVLQRSARVLGKSMRRGLFCTQGHPYYSDHDKLICRPLRDLCCTTAIPSVENAGLLSSVPAEQWTVNRSDKTVVALPVSGRDTSSV